ncbi:MAG: methylase N-4/N-6 protein [Candidatus Woesebacteria bacterium GW2011_GWA1_39_11b]|nr:MAG: methylase N-4/N-6 protein [Candidatus Woesebacteria bacterium GW2011_GWA1_39_11b]
METNVIYKEPCLETLRKMPAGFLDCVITSPPYWQLRDYGYEGQWGLEPTFQEYLAHLWEMMNEIYRVLKPTGTCWINLGDTYGTQSGNMAKPQESKHTDYAGDAIAIKQPKSIHKCLLLIPHRFAIGCIDRGWIMRNDCIWAKRNAMPESTQDRFSKKHEYFFFMVKQEKYYFDLDAIRDKSKPLNRWGGNKLIAQGKSEWDKGTGQQSYRTRDMQPNDGMKNPGDVSDFWNIPTKPSTEKHYASYNDALLMKPVLAGCPAGGLIYDPFMGTGSTAEVALRTGRRFIGSEMSEEYVKICDRRVSPFLNNIFNVGSDHRSGSDRKPQANAGGNEPKPAAHSETTQSVRETSITGSDAQ